MKIKLISSLLIPILIVVYVVKLLFDAGFFRKIQNYNDTHCSKVFNVIGPEDMAKLPGTSLIAISSDPRSEGPKNNRGNIYLYDTVKNEQVLLQEIDFPKEFSPHGIDIIQKGNHFLIYAIDQYNETQTRIDVLNLDLAQKSISFQKRIESEFLTAANDLSLIGEERFFFTRDFNTKNKLLVTAQQYLRFPTGSVWMYDKGKLNQLAGHLFYANGIQFDSQHSTLYVSEMLNKLIHAYSFRNNQLDLEKSIHLPDGIDNLTLYQNEIIAAGHPNLISLKKMRDDRKHKSPSVIYSIDLNLSKITKLYENDGAQIAATSVGLKISNEQLILGSVFDDHILSCSL